ncbi:MAG: hydroxymyristoyl-ACP dehydratase [Paludibacteraceae bacterium]|nr:hydroxymyristoyl-ACP dehydratase [Paludibacteraceae bacterium]
MLLDRYFSIKEGKKNESGSEFLITLNPDHQVYQGHFPGDPICPGVCSIQMIRECAEISMGKRLTISAISQCRFSELLTPAKNKELLLRMTLNDKGDGTVGVIASLLSDDAQTSFLEYKGDYSLQC